MLTVLGNRAGGPAVDDTVNPSVGFPYATGPEDSRQPRAPTLGEHTDQILSETLGLSDGEIGRLHDDRIVAGPRR